jgi:phage terminase small subunit
MNPDPIPIPGNPRHRAFVASLWEGTTATAAYCSAGYRTTYAAARSSASRLRRRPDVAACILALQQLAHLDTLSRSRIS